MPPRYLMCAVRYASRIDGFRCSVDAMESRTDCKVAGSTAIHWSLASKECWFTVNIANLGVIESYLLWRLSYSSDRLPNLYGFQSHSCDYWLNLYGARSHSWGSVAKLV